MLLGVGTGPAGFGPPGAAVGALFGWMLLAAAAEVVAGRPRRVSVLPWAIGATVFAVFCGPGAITALLGAAAVVYGLMTIAVVRRVPPVRPGFATVALPIGRSFDAATFALPVGRTFDMAAVALPVGRTFDMAAVALPVGRTFDMAAVTPPGGRTFDMATVAVPGGQAFDAATVGLPGGRTFDVATDCKERPAPKPAGTGPVPALTLT
ncbi:hypothetical protein [Actinoplanes sp. NPDC020271]|uniref:hypothetical protein n=1 Tax=Actinoplanes sp. NPDC020271 TaxID=3363896 RepID=UPI0037B722DD